MAGGLGVNNSKVFSNFLFRMRLLETTATFRLAADALRAEGRRLALVPTQGALHAGHVGLVAAAREAGADAIAISLFVNPFQYGPSEDPGRLPRTPERDLQLCEEAGVDLVFAPTVTELYPRETTTVVAEDRLSAGMCAVSRPVYFRAVATLAVKLCQLARPEWLVYGQVNLQQAMVVKRVLRDLNVPAEVLVGPTGRDPDGLACAARNGEFTPWQRMDALAIPRALRKAEEMVASGVRNVDRVVAEITHILAQVRRIRVLYVVVVDPATMEPRREIIPGRTAIALAAWVDEVRLVDNVFV